MKDLPTVHYSKKKRNKPVEGQQQHWNLCQVESGEDNGEVTEPSDVEAEEADGIHKGNIHGPLYKFIEWSMELRRPLSKTGQQFRPRFVSGCDLFRLVCGHRQREISQ